MITIRRCIEGVSINGTEYLLDENGNVMKFNSIDDAQKFLIDHGENVQNLEDYFYDDEPYTFHLGNVELTTHNINELREYVEEIQTKIGDGEELSKHLSDFCFDVEATYQRHHNLDQDNWNMVH